MDLLGNAPLERNEDKERNEEGVLLALESLVYLRSLALRKDTVTKADRTTQTDPLSPRGTSSSLPSSSLGEVGDLRRRLRTEEKAKYRARIESAVLRERIKSLRAAGGICL
jgi:hypothetical protein